MGTVLELHSFFVSFKSWFPYFVYLFTNDWMCSGKKIPPIFQNTAVYKQTLSSISLKDNIFSVICIEMQCRLPLITVSVLGIITTL